MNQCPTTLIEIGPQLGAVLVAVIGMVWAAAAGYGTHAIKNGGK